MSHWENFKKSNPDVANAMPVGMPIFGTFACQHCELDTDEATYYAVDSVLKWECPDGHVSFAENFRLG